MYLFESETGKFTDTTDFEYINGVEKPEVTEHYYQNRQSPSYCDNCIARRSTPLTRKQARRLYKHQRWGEYGNFLKERMESLEGSLKQNAEGDNESIGDSTLSAISSIDEYMADATASHEAGQPKPTKKSVRFQDNVVEQVFEADTLKAIQNSMKDQRVNMEDLRAHDKSPAELLKHADESNKKFEEIDQQGIAQLSGVVEKSSEKLKENDRDTFVRVAKAAIEVYEKLEEKDRTAWSTCGRKRRMSP